jgi:hypothetical protein
MTLDVQTLSVVTVFVTALLGALLDRAKANGRNRVECPEPELAETAAWSIAPANVNERRSWRQASTRA